MLARMQPLTRAASLLSLLVACAHAPRPRPDMVDIEARARFDLNCELVRLVVLERYKNAPLRVGAIGCGRRVSYSRRLRRHMGMLSARNTRWEQDGSVVAVLPSDDLRAY